MYNTYKQEYMVALFKRHILIELTTLTLVSVTKFSFSYFSFP